SVIRGDIEEIVVTAQRVTSVMGEGIREYEEMTAAAKRIWERTRTPMERYQMQLEHLNKLLAFHRDVLKDEASFRDTYDRAVIQAQEELDEALRRVNDQARANEIAFEGWMRSVSDGFADAILKAESFGDVLKRLLVQLA